MPLNRIVASCLALSLMAGPAFAQRPRGGFDESPPPPPNTPYQGPQGFSFQGDQLPPSHDRKYLGTQDPRYSQTVQQQQQQAAERPGGGCLRYGVVGAAGGHLAGHGVVGALAGCAVGSYVRHRDNARIRQQQPAPQ